MDENNKMESNTKQNLIKAVKIGLLICLTFFTLLTLVFVTGISGRLVTDDGILRDMENSLSEVSRKLDSMPQAGVHDSDEPAESNSPAEEIPTYTQEELINMAISDDFSNMMKVALYPEATESQLLFVATACAYSSSVVDETSAVRLATALLDHPHATSAIASALSHSESKLVWLIVAQSELSSESTLAVLADHCVSSSNGMPYDDPLIAVVSAICENSAVTDGVFNILEHTGNNYICFIVDTYLGKFPEP